MTVWQTGVTTIVTMKIDLKTSDYWHDDNAGGNLEGSCLQSKWSELMTRYEKELNIYRGCPKVWLQCDMTHFLHVGKGGGDDEMIWLWLKWRDVEKRWWAGLMERQIGWCNLDISVSGMERKNKCYDNDDVHMNENGWLKRQNEKYI